MELANINQQASVRLMFCLWITSIVIISERLMDYVYSLYILYIKYTMESVPYKKSSTKVKSRPFHLKSKWSENVKADFAAFTNLYKRILLKINRPNY